VKPEGPDEAAPGTTSSTCHVPSAVPSLRHTSQPLLGSQAWKTSQPFTSVRPVGFESPGPGLMSLTSTVPATVPSLVHSSRPLSGSDGVKNSVPSTSVCDPKPERSASKLARRSAHLLDPSDTDLLLRILARLGYRAKISSSKAA
jgi:hypothetical protein